MEYNVPVKKKHFQSPLLSGTVYVQQKKDIN